MSRSENLPALPQVAGTVLRLADDTDSSTREIERVVEKDAATTAKLLKVANSAYYGSLKVPSLGRAIALLGLSTVRSVVVGLALQQMTLGKGQVLAFDRLVFWKHCLAVATAARIVGKIVNPGKAEELYCAGMMHEIGLLALDKFAPEELESAFCNWQQSGGSLAEAETQVCGFDHFEVGAVLAERWGLSDLTVAAVRHHLSPFTENEYQPTTLLVALAESIANRTGFAFEAALNGQSVDPMLVSACDLAEQQIDVVCEVVSNELVKAQEAFKIAS